MSCETSFPHRRQTTNLRKLEAVDGIAGIIAIDFFQQRSFHRSYFNVSLRSKSKVHAASYEKPSTHRHIHEKQRPCCKIMVGWQTLMKIRSISLMERAFAVTMVGSGTVLERAAFGSKLHSVISPPFLHSAVNALIFIDVGGPVGSAKQTHPVRKISSNWTILDSAAANSAMSMSTVEAELLLYSYLAKDLHLAIQTQNTTIQAIISAAQRRCNR